MRDTHQRFDEVFDTLDRERRRFDHELQRLAAAAAYLGTVLGGLGSRPGGEARCGPKIKNGRHAIRRRCDPGRRRP